MTSKRLRARMGVAILGSVSGQALAQDTFSISAMTTDGSMITETVGASSLPDLVNDVADQAGGFSAFANRSFTASLNYAGVANAASITVDPNGGGMGVETLSITLLGVENPINFSEANGNLGDQLEDFFLKDSPGTISDFLQAINRESAIAVADGNPLATTARSTQYKFNRFGMFADGSPNTSQVRRRFRSGPTLTRVNTNLSSRFDANALAVGLVQPSGDGGADATLDVGSGSGGSSDASSGWLRTRLDVGAATFEADNGAFDGTEFTVAPSWETSFSDRFSVALGIPLSYHEIGGSEVFNAGVHLDAPIKLVLPSQDDGLGFFWQITPGVAVDLGASYDFAAGGLLLSYGGTNLFQFSLGDFDLVIPTSFYHYDSVPVETSEIEFDSGVEQQIFRQGVKLAYSPTDRFTVFAGASYTRFFEDVAVEDYYSPTAGLGWTFKNGANVTLAYEGDFADNDQFSRNGGRLSISVPF